MENIIDICVERSTEEIYEYVKETVKKTGVFLGLEKHKTNLYIWISEDIQRKRRIRKCMSNKNMQLIKK